MDNKKIQLVGEPVNQHGAYTFYKSFKYLMKNGQFRTVSISEFFFVKIWNDSDLVSIGELQLLWEDKNSDKILSSLRLYFLPENTPDGRREDHGEVSLYIFSYFFLLNFIARNRENQLTLVFNGYSHRFPCMGRQQEKERKYEHEDGRDKEGHYGMQQQQQQREVFKRTIRDVGGGVWKEKSYRVERACDASAPQRLGHDIVSLPGITVQYIRLQLAVEQQRACRAGAGGIQGGREVLSIFARTLRGGGGRERGPKRLMNRTPRSSCSFSFLPPQCYLFQYCQFSSFSNSGSTLCDDDYLTEDFVLLSTHAQTLKLQLNFIWNIDKIFANVHTSAEEIIVSAVAKTMQSVEYLALRKQEIGGASSPHNMSGPVTSHFVPSLAQTPSLGEHCKHDGCLQQECHLLYWIN
ncbi:hypothetical protein B566_EDAN010956, partial [Ephemera danica]